MPIQTKPVTPELVSTEDTPFKAPEVMTNNDAYKERLKQLPEVKNLTNEINIMDVNSVIIFGQKPSQGISQMSDSILATTKRVTPEEASRMIVQLTKLMDKFDIKELETPPENQSAVKRMFTSLMNSIDKLYAKYENLGKDVDKIRVILEQNKNDIMKTQQDLEQQYQANVTFYQDLEKYIVAGELAQEEIQKELASIPGKNMPEDQKQMYHQRLEKISEMLDSRIYDLRLAENVAMQTCPMIFNMQVSNFNLLRQIESSFIITLPIFKQCIINAIQLKRQAIQSEANNKLAEKTQELWMRNAQNTATQTVNITRDVNKGTFDIDKLQSSYQTIFSGIEQSKQIADDLAKQRKTNTQTLETMKQDMIQKGFVIGQ